MQLQQHLTTPQIKHIKAANLIVDRAIKNRKQAGLHFPRLRKPVRLASVGDASHGNKTTSYPQEGQAALLMEDHLEKARFTKKDEVDQRDEHLFGGP